MSGTVEIVERIFPVNLPALQKIEVNQEVKLEEQESNTLELY
jgi:ribosomal protein L19